MNINFLDEDNKFAKEFCANFISPTYLGKKYVLGTNELASKLCDMTNIDGFIDEYTDKTSFKDKPILSLKNLQKEDLVVSMVLGKPLLVKRKLTELKITNLDFFAFVKYSSFPSLDIRFWGEFQKDFEKFKEKYMHIYNLLADDESKNTFEKIINFRLSYNIQYLEGFIENQDNQYFEPFLNLKQEGESFADVGGYDGYTSNEFLKKSSKDATVHFFEPDSKNLAIAKKKLSVYKNINYYPYGLSNEKNILRFNSDGSCSSFDKDGDIEINVDKLDNLVKEKITFLKMDIEGAESMAIDGAKQSILKSHPRLAICVYHQVDDLWKIPEQVLSIRNDYTLYLRHYTEGVDETVMFFIPKEHEES